MDHSVIWSPAALNDVDAIAEYISQDSPVYAAAVVSKIIDVSRKLKLFSSIGRIVPEIGDVNIRECFVYSYRIIYRITDQTVLIVAVVHGKRLLAPLLDQMKEAP